MEVSNEILKRMVDTINRLEQRISTLTPSGGQGASGLIRRKPDSARLDGVNQVKETDLEGCVGFTIQNVGAAKIYYGFTREYQDIEVNVSEFATWDLAQPCNVWSGKLYVRFAASSVANILKTV